MTWIATAVIGSAALGYLGSRKAAGAQSDAANQAAGISREQYAQNREDLAPWRTSGNQANQKLMEYLGLATPQSRTPGLTAPTREQFMTASNTGGYDANGPIFGGAKGGTDAFGRSVSTNVFDQAGFDKATADYNAQLQQTSVDPEGFGSLLKPFTGTDLVNEPGYQYGIQQGEQGINRAAAGRGSYDSGATLKALLRFNQDYGGTKYGEAFNRDAANKSSIYGMLSGVSGTGANAAGQTAGLGANAANAQGGYATNAGDARAAGYVGGANAIIGGVGNYLGYQQNQQTLDYLKGLRQPIAGRSAYNSDFTLR